MRRSSVVTFAVGFSFGVIVIMLTMWQGTSQNVSRNIITQSQPSEHFGVIGHNITSTKATSKPTSSKNKPEAPNHADSTQDKIPSNHGNTHPSPYPEWFKRAWDNSPTAALIHQYVGDRPLLNPPCSDGSKVLRPPFLYLEPKRYLPNSKNPCWYEQSRLRAGLHCIPYFYLAGVAKCGTSDLYRRLMVHPDLLRGSNKEYHWWERGRFLEGTERQTFLDYVESITGDRIKVVQKDLQFKQSSIKLFGDFSPSYFFHPTNWPLLDGNQGCLEPRIIVSQHIHHLYPQAKILLTFRHPTSRLYSRFLSRIPRTPFLQKATVKDFHDYVIAAIKTYRNCFKRWSIRHCVYNSTLFEEVTTRLVEGMYPTFMADWLRVWPREQMHIMRYEDYGGHEEERIAEIFNFLGLSPLNSTEMKLVSEHDIVNSGAKEYQQFGSMLPETKKALDDFYQPFILQFADILNEKRFLWLDTEH